MNVKFVPNLFLEVVELERFKQSLDQEGFRKNIIENTSTYGLIKNSQSDPNFLNGRIQRDLDDSNANKTIKIAEVFGIDQFGQFIYSPERRGIPIPNDGNWWWVKVAHQYSNEEKGNFTIAQNGDLSGSSDAELTKIFRGQPNFPTRIKFSNSQYNTLEYDVLEVIDDQHAIIQHPALNQVGVSAFEPESGLKIRIVGTFTPGVAVPPADKFIFQYDWSSVQLVQETVANTRPVFVKDTEFYLARVKVDGLNLIIQDKRVEYWDTKGSYRPIEIDRQPNTLIGVENIKWNHPLTPADRNIVEIAWGMRSQNWSVDSSQNILTLFGSATGGRFKEINDFTTGDFNGWRVYTSNGKYSRVLDSLKQGSAINLKLEVLDVDNYSNDGGVTFNNQGSNAEWVLVVPDADSIDLKFSPHDPDNQEFQEKIFNFPINTLLSKSELVVFKDPTCLYNIQYRYKSFKEFTEWVLIPDDTISGYYSERSFDDYGNLKPALVDRIKKTYTGHATNGFVELELSPNSYARFRTKVDKGDIIGVETYTFLNQRLYNLTVGVSKNYHHIVGDITLNDDIYFNLVKTGAVEGNEFRIHFECNDITLGTKNIYIAQEGTTPGSVVVIKKLEQGDVWMMRNQEHGIVFDCIFDGTSWFCYQNYDLGKPYELATLDGNPVNLFDANGLGKIRGLYGYAICDGRNGTVNLSDRFLVGYSTTKPIQTPGGSDSTTVTLGKNNIPRHRHRIYGKIADRNTSGGGFSIVQVYTDGDGGDPNRASYTLTGDGTGDLPAIPDPITLNTVPKYYAILYAKKLF